MYILRTIISFLRDREYRNLLFATALILAFGTGMYMYLEGWGWIDALYFCVVTLSTIGFGDFTPQTDAGKLFTVFYVIIGIGLILTFINTLYDYYRDLQAEEQKAKKGEARRRA